MLTENEVLELRDSVRASEWEPIAGPWCWAQVVDGPLAGLRVRVKISELGWICGWGQVTERGPVIVNYAPSENDPRLLLFTDYDWPGAGAAPTDPR
jgi:hypothetical protein